MTGKRTRFFALTALLLLLVPQGRKTAPASAQTAAGQPPSVAVYQLENRGTDASTVTVVGDLLFSFIREMRDYRLDFLDTTLPQSQANGSADGEKAAHDFLFHGALSPAEEGGIRLELALTGKNPDTERYISRTYENQNKVMLGTRLLVRELFESAAGSTATRPPAAAGSNAPSSSGPEQVEEEAAIPDTGNLHLRSVDSLDALAGSWNGEDGIEKIMILRGGRGAAVFSSGFSLMISLAIQNGELVVSQRGRSSPLQFLDLPDPVAEQAAEQAPPIEWRFLISDDGTVLAGEKNSVQITHDGQKILSMDEKTEKVAWVRN